MLSTDGDIDRWETKILVSDPKSGAEIVDVLAKGITAGATHMRGPASLAGKAAGSAAGSTQIKWNFADDKGRPWHAWQSRNPRENKEKFILTLKLSRTR